MWVFYVYFVVSFGNDSGVECWSLGEELFWEGNEVWCVVVDGVGVYIVVIVEGNIIV